MKIKESLLIRKADTFNKELEQTPYSTNKGNYSDLKMLPLLRMDIPLISSASINGQIGVYLSIQGQLGSDTYELTKELETAIESLLVANKEK